MEIDYQGAKIFYQATGKGKAIIFLHGFLENSKMWNEVISSLPNDYQYVTIDLPGHGKSGMIDGISTMESMAEVVQAIVDKLAIKEAIIIGHSMGGYVALALADKHPDVVMGLCLLNSTPFSDTPERQELRERAIEVMKKDKRTFISISISNLFAPENILKFNKETNTIKKEAYSMTIVAIESSLRGMKMRPDRASIFKNLDCKKLMVLGKKDNLIDVDRHNEFFDTHVQIEVLEGGHMLHIENKSEITYIIKRFIEN